MLPLANTQAELNEIEAELQRLEQRDGARWIVSTFREVATFFGVEVRSVKERWAHWQPPMPGEEGRYDLSAIARWRIERLEEQAGLRQSSTDRELDRRNKELTNAHKELRLQQESGLLVERAAVAAVMAEIMNDVRVQLERLPATVAAVIDPAIRANVQRDIGHQIELILRRMSQRADNASGAINQPVPKRTRGRPVGS